MRKYIYIFERLKRKEISQKAAAYALNLSTRHVRRKFKRYNAHGIKGLSHKLKGRESNRKTSDETCSKIVELYKTKFSNYGPTLFAEKLSELCSIHLSTETIRSLLIRGNVYIPRKQKTKKSYFLRDRKECKGELVQIDGSIHQWFGDEKTWLLTAVDDATGELYARFLPENTEGMMIFLRSYIEQKGAPTAFYSDRGSVYKVNQSIDGAPRKTQLQRALQEVSVTLIHARSPQAKGRVERVHRTLQDRLVKHLAFKNITTADAANKELILFLDHFNKKFMKSPVKPESLLQFRSKEDLDKAFCIKEKRKVLNGNIIKFGGSTFQVDRYEQPHLVRINSTVEVRTSLKKEVTFYQKGSQIKVLNINRRTPKPKTLNFEGKALSAGNFATLLRKQMKSQLRQ